MALRALVFSSDGSTTSALCHVLTDLGIEAEICSEMLVAVERVTSQPYDALLVDWDQQAEAVFLLKQLRELKLTAQALTLALVQNDEDLPQALQAGANSVIRKPIDTRQAQETLSTAKQLILGRQTEQRNKESRLAAEQVANSAEEDVSAPEEPQPVEAPSRKGFLPQTAPRTGIEAEELAAAEIAPDPPAPPPPSPLSGQSVRDRALSFLGYGAKPRSNEESTDDSNANTKEEDPPSTLARRGEQPETPSPRESRSQDATHVFSSLPDEPENPDDEDGAPASSHYGLYAFAAMVLIAAALWVFAPGDSYFVRLRNWRPSHVSSQQVAAAVPKTEIPPLGHRLKSSKTEEPVLPDPALTDEQDAASINIQVIENKPIPVAGAQQPPGSEKPADPSAPVPDVPDSAPAPVSVEPAALASHPQLQPAAATQTSSAPPQPAIVPLAPVVRDAPDSSIDPSSGRTGVIIPDSLKNSPAASPASTLEPPTVPEETSRTFLLKKVDPDYPPQALSQRLEGPVVLQASVGTDGSIRDLKLVRGYFLLGRAAFEAVKQWRFKPYSQNGKAINFQTYITINFRVPS